MWAHIVAIWLKQAVVVVVSLSRHDLRLHTKWSFNRASRHSARVTLQCHGDKVSVIVTIWTETFWYTTLGTNFSVKYIDAKKDIQHETLVDDLWDKLASLELIFFAHSVNQCQTNIPKLRINHISFFPYLPELFKQLSFPMHPSKSHLPNLPNSLDLTNSSKGIYGLSLRGVVS